MEKQNIGKTFQSHISGYQYQPLDTSKNQIRVLEILPQITDKVTGPIRCKILTVSLDDLDPTYQLWKEDTNTTYLRGKKVFEWQALRKLNGKSCQRYQWGDYVAISYTWGSTVTKHSIILDGQPYDVPKSVNLALRAWINLQDSFLSSSAFVWIDYLCINQHNIEDKCQQIPRMRTIFGSSMMVVVDLGEVSEDSNLAIDLVNRIHYNSYKGYDYKRHLSLSLVEKMKGTPYYDQRAFCAVRKLLARPYWRRLWVIQELVMADDELCFVTCGDKYTTLLGVRLAMKLIGENILVLEGIAPCEESGLELTKSLQGLPILWYIGHLRNQSLMWEESTAFKYFELRSRVLYLSQNAIATHSYDKVFGIMGLLPRQISQPLEPLLTQLPSDTARSSSVREKTEFVRTVFIKFAVSIIEATRDLDIIFARNTFQKQDSHLKLPSWVTDWTLGIDRSGTVPSNDWHFVAEEYETTGEETTGNPLMGSRPWIATLEGRRADAGRQGTIEFLKNSENLSCQAILIGCVDGIAPELFNEGDNPEAKWPARIVQPQFSESPYATEEKTVDALLRTLLFDPKDDCIHRSLVMTVPWFGEEADNDAAAGTFVMGEKSQAFKKQLEEHGWDLFMQSGQFFNFEVARRCLGLFRVGGKPFKDHFPRGFTSCLAMPAESDFCQIAANLTNRRLITTRTGQFGLAPSIVRPGDQIFVILGCSVPVILRRCDNSEMYDVVGECWVDGFMRGEAIKQLDSGLDTLKTITLY